MNEPTGFIWITLTPNESQFKKRKMATGGDLSLTDRKIEHIAPIIVPKHMATIAIKYLGLPYETVENLKLIRQNDYIGYNRDLLILWRNKNPRINQGQVSTLHNNFVRISTLTWVWFQ